MIKLGALLAVATTSTSAVASPYVASYANINLPPKEYSADSFFQHVYGYIGNKYDIVSAATYQGYIHDLLDRNNEATHDDAFRNAIEDKIEEAYESDPFNNRHAIFDPTDDMTYNIANVITDWFDQTSSWVPGMSTASLISTISAIPVGADGAAFDAIELDFNSWITSIRSWGVNQNNFNDINDSMQTVVDAKSLIQSPYYMEINEFYDLTSDEIMDGKNHDAIKSEMETFNNGQSTIADTRVDELQFNVLENNTTLGNLVAGQQIQLDNIADTFKGNNDFENMSNSLNALDTDIYPNFVDALETDVANSMDDMELLENIGESYKETTSNDLWKFFEPDDAQYFNDNYKGAEINIISTDMGSTGEGQGIVQVKFQIIDTNDAVIYETTNTTNYHSDVLEVQNFIETMRWTFLGTDDQDLKNIQIEDENILLTSQQLYALYDTYEQGVEIDYPFVIVEASHELVQVPGEDVYNFIVTFDISQGSTTAQVIREHELAIFDNELEGTIDRIEEQLQDVDISELSLKMGSHFGNVDLLDTNLQESLLGKTIEYSPNVVLDKLTLIYDMNDTYPGGFTTILVSISNPKSSEEIVDRSLQVNITRAIEQAQTLMNGAEFQHLYKQYVKDWYSSSYDIKSFAFYNWENVPEFKWVFENMLDSTTITRDIILADGSLEVDIVISLINKDNNERGVVNVTRDSMEYDLPIDQADIAFSSYEFKDPLNIDSQLASINDSDNPTVDEMENMIFGFRNNYDDFNSLEVDGPDPVRTSIGGIDNTGVAPFNELTLTDNNGNVRIVTIQYDTNLVSGAEIYEFNEELIEHTKKVEYILSELVLEENIAEGNYEGAKFALVGLANVYAEEAPTKTNDEWEDYKKSTLERLYGIFGVAWSGDDTNTQSIIDEIHEDYPEGIPSSIQNRIDDYIAGITAMPYPMGYDHDDLDEVVDIILSLTKTTFLVEPIDLDLPGKIMIFASGVTLAVVSGMALISTSRMLITQRKLRQLDDPTIRYSSPKKLVAFSAVSAIIAAAASITLMVYIFVTKGGL